MNHSKTASVLLPLIFLLAIFYCVHGDDIYYPNLNLDDLFKAYPNLPPLDIIPGKTLLTPSTSIDELEKDLEIVNKHFESLTRIEAIKADWRSRCNLSRQYAFLRLLKYKELNITNPVTERLLERYLQLGELSMSLEDQKKRYNIRKEGLEIIKKYHDEFENEIMNGKKITTEDRDVELQSIWKSLSEKAGQEMKVYLDKYLKNIDEMTKKYGKAIGINDSLTFWHYSSNYNFLSNNELKRLWKNELRLPYEKLMKYMRKDFTKLYENYTVVVDDSPMPAYIFDMIFLTHSVVLYEKYKGFSSPQIKKRFEGIWNVDDASAPKYNVRTLTEEVQKYYESLGFPKVKKTFWKKSIFENVGNNGSFDVSLVSYKQGNETELAVKLRVAVNFSGYQRIVQVLLDYHRKNLLFAFGKPMILWDSNYGAFQAAFINAVMMSATSVRRLTSIGFMKKDFLIEELLDWYKANAVTLLTGLAFATSSHIWRSDMIEKNIGPKNRLAEYWNIRKKFELVVPKTRSPEDADTHDLFDIYSGVRILEDEYTLDHLALHILPYQIFARFCEIAGKFNPKRPLDNPLNTCDFSGNDKVAKIIRTIIIDGSLNTWREAFDIIMGKPNSTISAKDGLLLYYAPLFSAIGKENKEKKVKAGQ